MDVGTVVDGRYEIRTLLGAGAMGAVYEAAHTGTGRRVAIKVINSGDVNKDQKLVGRFQREAKAAGAIDTQHITQVLDTGVDRESGLPFLVMELLRGEDLQNLFRRLGAIQPEFALRLVAQACIGLQKAHDAHVVHRDVKPANLFLSERDDGDLVVKLLDFGIAKVKMDQANETESAGLTKTGSMIGSPLYMSPEQALGSKSIDHRTDIWSLGVVLYQALTGRTPFQHIDALGQLIISICHEAAPPVQHFSPWVPDEVVQIVERAMMRDAGERYQSAAEMLDAVRTLLPGGWSITPDMLVPMTAEARRSAISLRPPPPLAIGQAPARTAVPTF
ncbi:MAG TPA: serine/threonine-protein kinase, partial [Minicystis sp.]|nr:serine/threonine-protein kinase [Minicystis sp.]